MEAKWSSYKPVNMYSSTLRQNPPIKTFASQHLRYQKSVDVSHQTTEEAKKIYHHLEGLTLADLNTSNEEIEVDSLVGSDQYWNLITGPVRRGDSGPNAMETKVG